VTDLPPDLPQLRTLRTWHQLWVQRLDQAIAAAEQREAEVEQGRQRRPPEPDWLIERGLDGHTPPVAVHVGGCHMAGKRSVGVTEDDARRALAAQVPACTHCSPDSALGVPD
jgi:hypothetical protein